VQSVRPSSPLVAALLSPCTAPLQILRSPSFPQNEGLPTFGTLRDTIQPVGPECPSSALSGLLIYGPQPCCAGFCLCAATCPYHMNQSKSKYYHILQGNTRPTAERPEHATQGQRRGQQRECIFRDADDRSRGKSKHMISATPNRHKAIVPSCMVPACICICICPSDSYTTASCLWGSWIMDTALWVATMFHGTNFEESTHRETHDNQALHTTGSSLLYGLLPFEMRSTECAFIFKPLAMGISWLQHASIPQDLSFVCVARVIWVCI
jgi:hypothetical protein